MIKALVAVLALCLVGCASAEKVAAYRKNQEDLTWMNIAHMQVAECKRNHSESEAKELCKLVDPRDVEYTGPDLPHKDLVSTSGYCAGAVCRSTTIVNGAIVSRSEMRFNQVTPVKKYRK